MPTISELVVQLRADNKDLKRKLNQSKKDVDSFGKTISKVGGLIAGAFAVDQVIAFGKEAVKVAAKAEGIATAFAKIENSDKVFRDIQTATRGTVDNITLMQKTLQAQNLGLSVNDLARFFEFATKRAIETGESVDYLVDSIVTGVGRRSVLIMDNLGISSVRLSENINELGLSFQEASSKIITEELEKMGGVANTTATEIAQLQAQWSNFTKSAGDAAIKLFGVLDNVVNFPMRLAMFDAVMRAEKVRPDLFQKDPVSGPDPMTGISIPELPELPDTTAKEEEKKQRVYEVIELRKENNDLIEEEFWLQEEITKEQQAQYDLNVELYQISRMHMKEAQKVMLYYGETFDSLNDIASFVMPVFSGFASSLSDNQKGMQAFLEYFKRWATEIIVKLSIMATLAGVFSALTGGSFMGAFKSLLGFGGNTAGSTAASALTPKGIGQVSGGISNALPSIAQRMTIQGTDLVTANARSSQYSSRINVVE